MGFDLAHDKILEWACAYKGGSPTYSYRVDVADGLEAMAIREKRRELEDVKRKRLIRLRPRCVRRYRSAGLNLIGCDFYFDAYSIPSYPPKHIEYQLSRKVHYDPLQVYSRQQALELELTSSPSSTKTLRFFSCVETATSKPGFPENRLTGFNATTIFSDGITGQSSMRGL